MIQYDKPSQTSVAPGSLKKNTKSPKHQPRRKKSTSAQTASGSSLSAVNTLSTATRFEDQPLQNKADSKSEVSASRVIWNALAITSMITLIGFGLLSLKLSRQLNQAQVNLQAVQSQLLIREPVSIEGRNVLRTNQEQARTYQNPSVVTQNQYATLQTEYLTVQEEASIAQLNASLVDENTKLAKLRSIDQQRLTLMSAANQALILFSTESTPSLQGTLYMKEYRGLLVLYGLEVLNPDQAYQLWLFTENGVQIPAGLITAQNNQNPVWTEIEISQQMPNFIAAGVSIEPIDGSMSPTGPMILSSEISG